MEDDSNTCEYEEAKYSFLEHLDKYLQYGEKAESYQYSKDYDNICTFTEKNFVDNYNDINKICRKFEYLVDLLLIKKVETTINDISTVQYLNYWLNIQLKKINNNSVCAKFFHQQMKTKDNKYKELDIFRYNIYDIRKNELINMKKLIYIYKKYNEINKIITTDHLNEIVCIKIDEKCEREYKNAVEIYSNENANFCGALKSFKSKHDKLNLCTDTSTGWKKITLPQLRNNYEVPTEDCEISLYRKNTEPPIKFNIPPESFSDASNNDKKNIVIPLVSVLGISFIGSVLYKFTSFGSLLLPRVDREKKIWNHLTEEEDTLLYSSQHPLEESESRSYNMSYSSVEAT